MRWVAALALAACSRTGLDVPEPIDASNCVAAPVTSCTPLDLVTDVTVRDLAMDDAWIYFATSTSVSRVGKNGGPTYVLDAHGATNLAVDDHQLFFSTDSGIRAIDTACDAPPARLASSALKEPAALGLDPSFVYAIDSSTNALWKISRADGSGTELHTFTQPMRVVVADGEVLVSDWTNGVQAFSLDGVPQKSFGSNGSDFIVVSLGEVFGQYEGGVYFASLTEGASGAIANDMSAAGIAADEAHVYWADASGVWRASRHPASVDQGVLVAPATHATFVDVDDACLYYTTSDRIIRAPK